MSKKTKNGGVSMSRLPGNRSAKFVPYLVPGLVGLLVIVVYSIRVEHLLEFHSMAWSRPG